LAHLLSTTEAIEKPTHPNLTTDPARRETISGEPLMFVDTKAPAVRTALASQQGSTWPAIPWSSPTSWNGWVRRPMGIEYAPAITSSGPAKWARYEWRDLPCNYKDDWYMVFAATHNAIVLHSSFGTPAVMKGFERAVKSVCKIRF